MKKETKIIYTKLRRIFDRKAYKSVPGGAKLTSIKAQYFIERLNEVLGPDAWHAVYDITSDTDELITIKCQLNIDHEHLSVSRQSYGCFKKSMGGHDTHKKAMTDALKKACSHIGVGNETFKGNINPDGSFKSEKLKAEYIESIGSAPKVKSEKDKLMEKIIEAVNKTGIDGSVVTEIIKENITTKNESKTRISHLNEAELAFVLVTIQEKINGGS